MELDTCHHVTIVTMQPSPLSGHTPLDSHLEHAQRISNQMQSHALITLITLITLIYRAHLLLAECRHIEDVTQQLQAEDRRQLEERHLSRGVLLAVACLTHVLVIAGQLVDCHVPMGGSVGLSLIHI